MTKNGIPDLWTLTSLARSKTRALIFLIFSCLGATGAALLLNVMTFCFFAPGLCTTCHSNNIYQYSYRYKLICGANSGSKKHPIYYMYIGPVSMYSDWATALSAGKSPISGRGGNALKVPKLENRSRATSANKRVRRIRKSINSMWPLRAGVSPRKILKFKC
jgi:hypothetical protein